MKLLALLATSCIIAAAADLCPSGGPEQSGSQPGAFAWRSFAATLSKGRVCLGNEIRNTSGAPLELHWNDAGPDRVRIGDRLEVSVCFENQRLGDSVISYGPPARDLKVRMIREPEEGTGEREEGYPDLLEAEARVRTISIRGTLMAGTQPVRLDLLLKCSASAFAKEFAYQYSITDRSPDAVTVDWDLLRNSQAEIHPSVQPIPNGKTYIFLTGRQPAEAEGVIDVKTTSGSLVGRFRLDGFKPGAAH
jgi:hypothetical protein